MSIVSMALKNGKPHIAVCPDFNRAPEPLDKIVNIELPDQIDVRHPDGTQVTPISISYLLRLINQDTERENNLERCIFPRQEYSFSEDLDRASGGNSQFSNVNLIEAFAGYLNRLVVILNASVEVVAITMGQVNHLILVLPPYISSTAREKLDTLKQFCQNLKLTIVPYHASVMLFFGNGEIIKTPFIDIEWDTELRIGRRSFPSGTEEDLAFLGKDSVLRAGSLENWRGDLALWLIDKFKSNISEHGSWGQKEELRFHNWAHAVSSHMLDALLNEETTFSLEFDKWNEKISEKDMQELLPLLLFPAVNFVRAALQDHGAEGKSLLVISHGNMLGYKAVKNALYNVFIECQVAYLEENTDAVAALGAFQLVSPPACVPYDCGVLVRPAGERDGIGTLMLLRGAPVDTEAKSRTFQLPKSESRTLEVIFYTRQVDFSKSNITYMFARENVRFAPAHDSSGNTRFHAAMKLSADKEGRVNAVRTVLHDEISGSRYDFPSLPFTGGSPDLAVIQRGKSDKEAKRWHRSIDAVRNAKPQWSVRQWYQALQGGIVTREEYLLHLFGRDAYRNNHGLNLFTCPPNDLQKRGRSHIYRQMTNLARQISGKHVRAWQKNYPHAAQDAILSRDFKNSVFQDAANDKKKQDQAQELAHRYELTCHPPDNLNVDW